MIVVAKYFVKERKDLFDRIAYVQPTLAARRTVLRERKERKAKRLVDKGGEPLVAVDAKYSVIVKA